uniref:Chloride anion exchanger-like n=1 Tax=Poecilia latipinna TaxID=48699 RepID=A0A3B3V3T7_9TELE
FQPFEKQYVVFRPVYSEDMFLGSINAVASLESDELYLCFLCVLVSLLPVIGWMRTYRVREWLLGDVVSGVSTGLVAVMQGLAFSLLASLPPSYGLYTAFFPMLTYFFFGTSRHISVGSFPVLSLMVGAVVTRLVPEDGPHANITDFEGLTQDQQRVLVASSMTFLMGIFQLAMGVLQVGFIVVYLSDTLVSGFTTAAAVHILVSQLKFVLGLSVPGINGPMSMIYVSPNLGQSGDKINQRLSQIIQISTSRGLVSSYILYESPILPSVQVFQESAVEAFPVAIVGFAVAFSVAKVYSVKHDYPIDGNQELVAFGVSNIFGATFRSFAASTALSRTAVQESSGGKTQVAGLVSAMMAMIVTVALGFLLEPLPRSVLGALVIVNLKGMLMQFSEIPYLWRRDKPECVGANGLLKITILHNALKKYLPHLCKCPVSFPHLFSSTNTFLQGFNEKKNCQTSAVSKYQLRNLLLVKIETI